MNHFAPPEFWERYRDLPTHVRELADKNFALLKENPRHPSLHFKRTGRFFSARVGLSHRVLGVEAEDGVLWFWIGSHADYDKLLDR
ncbi:MAG: hypothetical protein M3494_16045 [Actinomycetota bacterium]|nr:hypothetical protein [Rubrobacter sp.]MDQ3509497.1 hypothetical protein [Actinomycetota bacterium]